MLGLNKWLILGASLAVVAVGTQGYRMGRDSVIASQSKAEAVRLETLHLAQLAAAEEIAKIQVVNRTIHARATREIIERPVYRDCVHSPDGMRAVNGALTGAIPADPGGLPGADAPGG